MLSAALVAGCGAGSNRGNAGAETVLVSAATKSEATSTFHMTASESMRSISGTPYFAFGKVTLSGDVDLATDSLRMTGTLVGGSPEPGTATEGFSLEVIQIGNDSWDSTSGLAGLGQLGGSVPPGHWIKDDTSSRSVSSPTRASSLTS